jgi:hypothetical protein
MLQHNHMSGAQRVLNHDQLNYITSSALPTLRLKARLVEEEKAFIARIRRHGSVNTSPWHRICIRNDRRTVCCIRAEAISEESKPTKSQTPCGGGFEYLYRSHASRRRQTNGNSIPGGILGPPCHWGTQIRGPGPPGWGSLKSETVKCGHKSHGTRTREWLRWRWAATIVNDRPILSSERMLLKDYDSKSSVEKISGFDPQGASSLDERIGSKSPVVK